MSYCQQLLPSALMRESFLSNEWWQMQSRLQKISRVSDRWGLSSRQDRHAVSSKVQGALQKIRRRAVTCNLLGKTQPLQSWAQSSCKCLHQVCVRWGLSRVRHGCGLGIQGVPSLAAEFPITEGCREMGAPLPFSCLPTGYLTRLQWWCRWPQLN